MTGLDSAQDERVGGDEPATTASAGPGDVGEYIAELQFALRDRDRELALQRAVTAESRARLAAIHRSLSWHLTRPLRAPARARRWGAARLRTLRARRRATVPVAALRPALEGGWPEGARWLPPVEIAGESRSALEQPTGTVVALPLVLPVGARLSARVALPLLAWHEHGGGARFTATLRDAAGEEIRSWTRSLGTVVTGEGSRWAAIGGRVPGATPREAVLTLELVATGKPFERPAVGSGLWGDLVIELPKPRDEAVAAARAPAPRAGSASRAIVAPRQASAGPRFSILTPVLDPPPEFLEQLVMHVRWQTFADWELCIVDDGSRDPRVRELLSRLPHEDERIRVERRDEPTGIAAATNAALAMARGAFVALLDHDDLLASDALDALAEALASRPDADMLYTDEDHVLRTGRRFDAYLKPDWSPELFRSLMFTGHLAAFRRQLALELGGFRTAFDGSQDYDFVLRLSERTDRIVHVPRLVYHWRVHERSAAATADAKPYAYAAARRALDEHLARTGVTARTEATETPGEYRIVHAVDPATTVALLLPLDASATADVRLAERLAPAVRAWRRSTHRAWELVVATPAACAARVEEALAEAGASGAQVHVVAVEGDDGCASLVNRAAAATDASHLLWMDGPLEVDERSAGWLERLLGYVAQPGVAAAGAKVLAADGRVEHAGVVFGDGFPLPAHHGADADAAGHLGNLRVVANWSAVSGAVMTARTTFERLGGLDASFGALAEIDWCLRLRAQGARIVLVPDALLHRREPLQAARNDVAALAELQRRWAPALPRDPYYNCGFWHGSGSFTPLEVA